MDKIQAQSNFKKLVSESTSLYPSALISLFEIDLSGITEERNISLEGGPVFRFHNNIKLLGSDITFQDNVYKACPIEAEGFEINSGGLLPKPTLRLSIAEESVAIFSLLKNQIRLLGDIVGAKVTRRRTFAKFLNKSNFNNENEPSNLDSNDFIEFPPDIYFVNRKSKENKFILEYELATIIELENLSLPRRQILSLRCNFTYRGEGCNYEYNERRLGQNPNDSFYGKDKIFGEKTILPESAPPVATDNDQLIKNLITKPMTKEGKFQNGRVYTEGSSVYIEKDGVKYYFVANKNGARTVPPNTNDWIADTCSKCLFGCKLRWSVSAPNGSVDVGISGMIKGELPFGGFPGVERLMGRSGR